MILDHKCSTVDILTPATREEWLTMRSQTLGASEVPALLGVSPWMTPFELHCLKSGLFAANVEETPAMRRGRLLEDDALTILQEERSDWTVIPNPIPGGKFFRDMATRQSCTPDAFVTAPGRPRGIAQVKSVQRHVFNLQWKTEDGAIEPPLHVAVQALQEARLTGSDWICVVALVVDYGIDAHVIEIPLHAGLIARIDDEVAAFWRGIEIGQPPDPDLHRDGALIEKLYQPNGEIIDLSADNFAMELVAERERLSADQTSGKNRLAEIKRELLLKMNGASAGQLADGRLITVSKIPINAHMVRASVQTRLTVKNARN